MKLEKFKIVNRFKNLNDIELDFLNRDGTTVLIGNNGSGKSNILEALSNVFAGLYNHSFNPSFSYELNYSKDNYKVEIKYILSNYEVRVNNVLDNLKSEYLPKQIISCYSGEESRLWDNYYEPFYKNYIKAIRGSTLPNSELVYINKYYWNIALLTFFYYDFAAFPDIKYFCENTIGIKSILHIRFYFNIARLRSWPANPVTNFVRALNPNEEDFIEIDLTTLKSRLSYLPNEIEFFRYLSASFMPKDDKLITRIELHLDGSLTADALSEGEKKLILIKLILEVIGDENSLILLDEPDSHVHVSRKEEIVKMLSQYSNRENIITTHSPTLTHHFENKHITMLSRAPNGDAKVESKVKQEVVHSITNGIWSYMEQSIFLNSNKDILLVEGKSDETFLKKALEVVKKSGRKYLNLDFEYLPCGGADGVKLMIDKFRPKHGQKIIAFFDQDDSGWKCVNAAFNETNKYNSNNFTYKRQNDIWIAVYPARRYFRGSEFNIEDYFTKSVLNKYVFENFKSLKSIQTVKTVKRRLEAECTNFNDTEFRFFTGVFDLILYLKKQP